MKINIFEEIIKLILIIFIIILIITIFFNKENFGGALQDSDSVGDVAVNNLTIAGSIDIFPAGIVAAWSGTTPPTGWVLCDGKNGSPDLTNRFIFGQGQGPGLSARKLGDNGGEETHLLALNEIAGHNHFFNSEKSIINGLTNISGGGRNWVSAFTTATGSDFTGVTGGNMPHNNMPPYYVLAYIMKVI
jgi:hypothetical protein